MDKVYLKISKNLADYRLSKRWDELNIDHSDCIIEKCGFVDESGFPVVISIHISKLELYIGDLGINGLRFDHIPEINVKIVFKGSLRDYTYTKVFEYVSNDQVINYIKKMMPILRVKAEEQEIKDSLSFNEDKKILPKKVLAI